MFNYSSPQDKSKLSRDSQKQRTQVNWQHNNETRPLSAQFGINDLNNYSREFGTNDKSDYGSYLGINDTSYSDAQVFVNNTNSHNNSHINPFNSSSTNASQNNSSEIHDDVDIRFQTQSLYNDTNFGFNRPNVNTLYHSQEKTNNPRNQTNFSQQRLLPNSNLQENNTNIYYNNQHFPQEQGSNFQTSFQEYKVGSNLYPQNLDPTIILHNVSKQPQQPQPTTISNFNNENPSCSTFNPLQQIEQSYFSPRGNLETPNVSNNFQNYSQVMPSPNPNSINNRDKNFYSNISRSQGSIPNLNCAPTPLGMQTTCSPHGLVPTLNITFSPAFHNSPSTMPTTPKSQNGIPRLNTPIDAQCMDPLNISQPLQNFVISHPIETNLFGSQTNTSNRTHNNHISTLGVDPSYHSKKNPQHSKHQIFGEALTSTSNSNLTRDITSNTSQSLSQDYSPPNLNQNLHEFEDFQATTSKRKNQKNNSKKNSQDSNEWNYSESDSDESSTPRTRKKILHLASKKLKCLRDVCGDNNDHVDPMWIQKTIVLPAQRYGCHNITHLLIQHLEMDLPFFKCGLAHIFLQESSASLTINETRDLKTIRELNVLISEGKSSLSSNLHGEGLTDDLEHIKSTIFGCSLIIPVTNGFLNIGKCQAIYLHEKQKYGICHRIVVTLNGT